MRETPRRLENMWWANPRVVYMRVRLAASGGDPPAPMEIDVAGGLGCGAMKGQ